MKADWHYPTSIRVGRGRLKEVSTACLELGFNSPLLVIDPGLLTLPMVDQVVKFCKSNSMNYGIFSAFKSNPTGENVIQGVYSYQKGAHDGIIALGGGSAIDVGKAIALMVGQTSALWDFEDIGDNWTRANSESIASVVAIPTTAGTGSEVGRSSVILDEDRNQKKIIFHPRMLPGIVILDPEVTIGLPANLTAATGMDALSHNLEALCSSLYHPMSEGIAIEGIRRIRKYLPKAVMNGLDIEARTNMLVASTMGATAFQRGLGAMHALAHPLGAFYGTHHGTLNAILMPYVLQANKSAIAPIISRTSRYVDIDPPTFEAFLDWVLVLRHTIQIPDHLEAIGITDQHVGRISREAVADPSAYTNPISFTAQDYETILRNAVYGRLEHRL